MATKENPPADDAPIPLGPRYGSIEEMLKSEGIPQEVATKLCDYSVDTRAARTLAMLRARHGLTQQEIAERIGVSQSTISKLESGVDESITLGEIRAYATALGERIGFTFGRPASHVESIKIHANAMRWHMLELAKLARADAEMDKAVSAFFGEAFFNILDILTKCQRNLPNGAQGCEIRMMVDEKPVAPIKPKRSKTPAPALG